MNRCSLVLPMLMERKTFTNLDGSHKAVIFERLDGTFGFEELAFDQDECAWIPFGRYSNAIVDTLDNAINEAKSRIAWLLNDAR